MPLSPKDKIFIRDRYEDQEVVIETLRPEYEHEMNEYEKLKKQELCDHPEDKLIHDHNGNTIGCSECGYGDAKTLHHGLCFPTPFLDILYSNYMNAQRDLENAIQCVTDAEYNVLKTNEFFMCSHSSILLDYEDNSLKCPDCGLYCKPDHPICMFSDDFKKIEQCKSCQYKKMCAHGPQE